MQYHLRLRYFSGSLQWQQHQPVSLWKLSDPFMKGHVLFLGKLVLGLLLYKWFTTYISSSTFYHYTTGSCLASFKTVYLILEQTSWFQNGTARTCACPDRESCRHNPNFNINAFCHMKYLTEERPWSYSCLLLIWRISSITDLWVM